jgi:hypothetical protein
MPKVTLVVCLYKERDFLRRLLEKSAGCYDELIVIHDGAEEPEPESGEVCVVSHEHPEIALDYSKQGNAGKVSDFWIEKHGTGRPGGIHELVAGHRGRFFQGPRSWQQEAHWAFAWSQSSNDWILRLDADEFPSEELRHWLGEFRKKSGEEHAGMYTCIWPLWNGKRMRLKGASSQRPFLFNRNRVRFFGMPEMGPMPDAQTKTTPLDLVLHHQPLRKNYGIGDELFRGRSKTWRKIIVCSLAASPMELTRWRWDDTEWPWVWEQLRREPVKTGFKRLFKGFLRFSCQGLRHFLICLEYNNKAK